MTIAAHSRTLFPTVEVAIGLPIDVVGHDEIQPAIVVVIKPCGARGPASRIFHTRSHAHVTKSTVSVVVVEDASAVTEHEQVGESIVVIIAHGDAHAE